MVNNTLGERKEARECKREIIKLHGRNRGRVMETGDRQRPRKEALKVKQRAAADKGNIHKKYRQVKSVKRKRTEERRERQTEDKTNTETCK